jgi:hypothetical protein
MIHVAVFDSVELKDATTLAVSYYTIKLWGIES